MLPSRAFFCIIGLGDFMKEKLIPIGVALLYMIFAPIVYSITHVSIHLFLLWNMFLALVPYLLILLYESIKKKNRIISYVVLVFWLLFYPNTFYLISDLIYIDQSQFVIVYGEVFEMDIVNYLGFFYLVIGAMVGIYMGIVSVKPVIQEIKETSKINPVWVISALSLVSATAIYIGRFFRYNSWDLLHFWSIIRDFFSQLSWFTVFYIGMYALIQFLILFLFSKRKPF